MLRLLSLVSPVAALVAAALSFGSSGCYGGADDAADPSASPTGSASEPIVHGRSDKGHDPAVVAIDIGGQALCTGSLVGPALVLTARHCVSETTEQVDCAAPGRQVQGDRAASSLTILVGDDVRTATPVARGAKLVVPDSDRLCDHDIALIELDRPVHGVTPLKVNLATAPRRGETVRAVGFGKRGDALSAGRKYLRAHVPILGVSAAELEVGEVTCNGDSGGPAFDEATGEIVGVVSRGGPGCDGPEARNLYTRTDAFQALFTIAARRRVATH